MAMPMKPASRTNRLLGAMLVVVCLTGYLVAYDLLSMQKRYPGHYWRHIHTRSFKKAWHGYAFYPLGYIEACGRTEKLSFIAGRQTFTFISPDAWIPKSEREPMFHIYGISAERQ